MRDRFPACHGRAETLNCGSIAHDILLMPGLDEARAGCSAGGHATATDPERLRILAHPAGRASSVQTALGVTATGGFLRNPAPATMSSVEPHIPFGLATDPTTMWPGSRGEVWISGAFFNGLRNSATPPF